MTTPTPRTDAQEWTETNRSNSIVSASFARQLEQELNEANLKAADRNGWQEVAMKVAIERDTLKRERDEAGEILNKQREACKASMFRV